MVDESRDESKKEQMAIVLRFVDAEGMIQERFLDLVHVKDTLSVTLKTSLWKQLLQYQFDVSKIRGQGYDGASNMRGEWNGLHALVRKDCPYAYYIHCFAHRLQLALFRFVQPGPSPLTTTPAIGRGQAEAEKAVSIPSKVLWRIPLNHFLSKFIQGFELDLFSTLLQLDMGKGQKL
ncbi:hypothetical protein L1987_00526 [Smallanthus sonchifolius]|uniref:Uncharacterized protein n=1 Tax=Smallanthus sonchifolius TaxID=185202 RepID=A0ACB9K2L0_9ASTR|nr:hypothetical protein L1987_00526 [Smallanthus sonchifolius]